MQIAFDYQIFQSQVYGGISRYHVELAKELGKLDCHIDFYTPIYTNQYLKNYREAHVKGIFVKNIPEWSLKALRYLSKNLFLSYLKNQKPDIVHTTYFNSPYLEKVDIPSVLTIHDMIHEIYPQSFVSQSRSIELKRRAILQVDHIICISANTYNDLLKIYNIPKDKVSIVHHGFNNISTYEDLSESLITEKPYVLYVGSRDGYKNFDALHKVFSIDEKLKKDFDIVCFGGGQFSHSEQLELKKTGLQDKVHAVSGNDKLLSMYYKKARAFIYPSKYEGFGMPPLEAMANNCPVIVSKSSSIPEIVGNAGKYFDPLEIDSLQKAIQQVVYDDELRTELIQSGIKNLKRFSWEKCAKETKAVYQKLR